MEPDPLHLLQIHPQGLRHIAPGRRVNEWRAPGRKIITHAASNERQVVIALSGGEIIYFEMEFTTNQLMEVEKKDLSGKYAFAKIVEQHNLEVGEGCPRGCLPGSQSKPGCCRHCCLGVLHLVPLLLWQGSTLRWTLLIWLCCTCSRALLLIAVAEFSARVCSIKRLHQWPLHVPVLERHLTGCASQELQPLPAGVMPSCCVQVMWPAWIWGRCRQGGSAQDFWPSAAMTRR